MDTMELHVDFPFIVCFVIYYLLLLTPFNFLGLPNLAVLQKLRNLKSLLLTS